MNQPVDSVEEKILIAAIQCIEMYGLDGTTSRRIAALAGVNGAAINYYFRSKDRLINACMERTLKNAFDWDDFSSLPGQTTQERCEAIFEEIIQGACDYPGVTRAHYYEVITKGKYDTLIVDKLTEFIVRLMEELKKRGETMNDEDLKFTVTQMVSVIMLMSMSPGIFKNLDIDLRDRESRKIFINHLVRQFLPTQ